MHYDCFYSIWKNHTTANTETSSTSEDSALCGIPKFSHGSTGLSHQHWVEQVVSAGGFGVHCTQAAEAMHKTCMKLPSQRVRHLQFNTTQASMHKYLMLNYLFSDMISDSAKPPKESQVVAAVACTIGDTVMADGDFNNVQRQGTFLHPQIRITCSELLDLLCDQFQLQSNKESYRQLESLSFSFGQQLTREDGEIFWATDSNYYNLGVRSAYARRRDILRIAGTETVGDQTNALCCEAVAFLVLDNVGCIPLPEHLIDLVKHGSLTFVLGRWFEPHPDAIERDEESRPICPGPLHINHCVWRYARSDTIRASICKPSGDFTNAVLRQMSMFGRTLAEQQDQLKREKQAYYCLLLPENIMSIANMSPTFWENSFAPDYGKWLETVTLV